MVHHVILWKIKEERTEQERAQIKQQVKIGLEGLKDRIPGIEKMAVHIEGLDSSTCDIMLDSVFADAAALKAYAVHPAHTAVADQQVRPHMAVRLCMDYED